MKNKLKQSLAVAAVGVTALGGSLALSQAPASAAGSCAGAGYLCFYDYGTATYGNVSGNNDNWGAFGWNDRADWFYNQGTQCSVRLYQHINRAGASYQLTRGSTVRWDNIVSSNRWCV